MTGHALPWNREPSGQQKADAKAARELTDKQNKLATRQEAELKQRKKRLNAQQITLLRSRFGAAASSASAAGGEAVQGMSDTASSLFARITGR
jgi:TRAP-type C4-dicarboxylate transport system substrate-binding protein